jgi:uncharacterized protein YjbK
MNNNRVPSIKASNQNLPVAREFRFCDVRFSFKETKLQLDSSFTCSFKAFKLELEASSWQESQNLFNSYIVYNSETSG